MSHFKLYDQNPAPSGFIIYEMQHLAMKSSAYMKK